MKKSLSYIVALGFTCVIALSAVGCKKYNTEAVSHYDLSSKNSSLTGSSEISSESSVSSASVSEKSGAQKSNKTDKKTEKGSNITATSGTLEATIPEDWYQSEASSKKPSSGVNGEAKTSSSSSSVKSDSTSEKSDEKKDEPNQSTPSSSVPPSSGTWKDDTLLSSLPEGFK